MPRKRIEIVYNSTYITYDELKQIERSTVRSKGFPKELLLGDIQIADAVFQPRSFYDGDTLDHQHVQELISSIKARKNAPLDPVLVLSLGDRFYLVDGHHRYAAYSSMPWHSDKPIPVEIFDGNLDGAVLECGIRNNKNKLPMSKVSKQEYAWNLVKLGVGSVREQHLASGAAKSTIGRMRSTYKELGATKAEGMSWLDVLRGSKSSNTDDSESYMDAKAHQLADAIKRSTDLKLVKHHDVLANAITIIHPSLMNNLVEYWTGHNIDDIQALADLETLDI